MLNNQTEDNEPIEPEYYVPIIPMILINGAEGIGTGYATKIPCYNPTEIISNLRNKLLNNSEFKDMDPFWHNFEGVIAKIDNNNYFLSARRHLISGSKIAVKGCCGK